MEQIGDLTVPADAKTSFAPPAVNYMTHLVYLSDTGNNVTYVVDGGMNIDVDEIAGSGNALAVMNCNPNCPNCGSGSESAVCDSGGEDSASHSKAEPPPRMVRAEASMGILTRGSVKQMPKSGALVRFADTKLEEGGVAVPDGDERVQVRQTGIYELHLRVPFRTTQNGGCYLNYALQINGAAVFEDELYHAGGRGRLRTGCGHHYERLFPGDIISVAVTNYQSDHPNADSLERTFLSVRKIG